MNRIVKIGVIIVIGLIIFEIIIGTWYSVLRLILLLILGFTAGRIANALNL